MKLLQAPPPAPHENTVTLPNDLDLLAFHANDDDITALHDWHGQIEKAAVIQLQFPRFNDGRAFSQAVALRRRWGYKGILRAIGDVLVDQVQQMHRCGFDEAVLREDQNLATAQRQLARFGAWYQGDAHKATPHFVS